jgi:hypothetical protein
LCICLNGSSPLIQQNYTDRKAKRRFISLGLLKIEYKEQWEKYFFVIMYFPLKSGIKDVERWSKIARFQLKIFSSSDATLMNHPSNQRSRSFFAQNFEWHKKIFFIEGPLKGEKLVPTTCWWDMMSLKSWNRQKRVS